jgi:hypothetical protein
MVQKVKKKGKRGRPRIDPENRCYSISISLPLPMIERLAKSGEERSKLIFDALNKHLTEIGK